MTVEYTDRYKASGIIPPREENEAGMSDIFSDAFDAPYFKRMADEQQRIADLEAAVEVLTAAVEGFRRIAERFPEDWTPETIPLFKEEMIEMASAFLGDLRVLKARRNQ